jgi:membrane protein YqaA with SNARE-associated domain
MTPATLANGWMHSTVVGLAAATSHSSSMLMHFLFSFGLVGLFLVSIVDSSFVPLPIPGVTDIMIVVLAAQHSNLVVLLAITTLGSALGGLFSHKVGQAGGMAFIEKHISPRMFHRVCDWMERHAILSVALPAILPPPMPLSPFVLAAGALQMSRKKFMISFTISRFLRHCAAAAIGVYFGPHVLHLWSMFSRKWAVPILAGLWIVILIFVGIALWRLYRTSSEMRGRKGGGKRAETASAHPG